LLGDNIRKIRKSKKISINKLSELSGVSLGYLSDLENNKVTNPTINTLDKLSEVLKVPLEFLVSDSEMDKVDVEPETQDDYIEVAKYAREKDISPEKLKTLIDILTKE